MTRRQAEVVDDDATTGERRTSAARHPASPGAGSGGDAEYLAPVSGMREDLSLLRERRFAALFAARTLSMLGLACAPVALAFGILRLPGADAGTLSLVVASEAIPHVLGLLLGGVVADRYPRRLVMFTGECLSLVAWLGIGTMLLVGWAPIPLVCAFAVLTGLAGAVVWPVLSGIIPEVAPPDRLQSANALLAVGANVARVGGLVAAGAVVVLIGPGWALVAAAAVYAAAAAFAWRIGSTPRPGREGGTSVLAELQEGWAEFSSREWLWVVVAQFALLILAWQGAHTVLGPVVAEAELGGAGAWSAILTGEAVGMLVGVLVALRLRPRRPILVGVLLSSLTALPDVLLGLGAPLALVVVAGFAMGLGMDTFTVLWQTTMQREVPAEALSRVASYDAFGSMLFGPVGVLLAGPAAVHLGAHTALLVCAAIILVSCLLALLSREVRTLRAPQVAAPAPEGVYPTPVDPATP